tara:strand:+ start:918 stop:1202 length:285 start_codon:yes stop_codon:yes gene_type:complete
MLLAEGDFEEAFIGFADRPSLPRLAIYDKNKCIELLIERGMTNQDAIDYFMFYEEDSWVGEGDEIPLFLNRMRFKDYLELYEYKGYTNDNKKET